jgi:hypothetical protein
MRHEVATDLSESARLFESIVWPAIAPLVRGGEMQAVESTADAGIARDLDVLAGIDAWQLLRSDRCMRGIASRVQWTDGKCWRTFTIRYSRMTGATTEWEKRWAAIRDGFLYPALTIHSYLSSDKSRLLAAGVVRTRELFEFVEARRRDDAWLQAHLRRVYDGNRLLWVSWDELAAAGVELRVATEAVREAA